MKYFFISNSGDENIIGKVAPQCKGIPSVIKNGYKWFDQPNSMTLLNNESFPNFKPDLIFELDENALLTDIVSPSNITAKGFLINEKTKDVIIKFNLNNYQLYPATLIVKKSMLKYYWLHFKTEHDFLLRNIDYQKSQFHICDLTYTKSNEVEIKSYEDYLIKRKNLFLQYISASKIIVNELIKNKEYDLFYFGNMFLHCFVSDRLVSELRANNITGFDLKDQNIL